MTVYGLISVLVQACGPDASFGNVHLWWSQSKQQLYLQKDKPCQDAEQLR